ncbi:MAG TPA: transglutaminase-like domain-containing protein, partial [Mycobacteriales bacterium]|nr:transglutaminase-like domain-containing protein [Mycobacteriales bacterium]
MTSASRDRFAEVVRAERVDLALACALIGVEVDADLDADAVVALLDDLAADVLRDVPADEPPSSVATALGRALGGRLGYCGTPEDYADLRSSLLHEVLRRRRGLPILLSVMYLEVGARLGLLVEGIGVPGHFVVGVTDGVERALLDPFAGGTPTTVRELAERAARGGAMPPLGDADLQAWGPVDILTRVLGNIRALSTSAESLR